MRVLQTVLIYLAYGFIRLLHCTYRFEFHGNSHVEHARRLGRGGSYLLAIWHNNLFAGILAQAGTPHTVMVSRSRDADAVAFLCTQLGYFAVRGSSAKRGVDKGGREAKDEMIERLAAGSSGAITVDGPTGPVHQVKPGIIEIARRVAAPIVPYAAIPESYWTFKTWDRFRLPKPFTKVHVRFGTPYVVPPEATPEQFAMHQAEVGARMLALEQAAAG